MVIGEVVRLAPAFAPTAKVVQAFGPWSSAPEARAYLGLTQLRGFRIGVTSGSRADDLIAALERRGAQVLFASRP